MRLSTVNSATCRRGRARRWPAPTYVFPDLGRIWIGSTPPSSSRQSRTVAATRSSPARRSLNGDATGSTGDRVVVEPVRLNRAAPAPARQGSTPRPSPLRFLDRSETLDAAPPVERWSRPQLRQMFHPNQERWVAGRQPEPSARLLEGAELLYSHQSSRRANFAFRSAASAWSIGRNVSFFIR